MTKPLRDYQSDLIDRIRKEAETNARIIAQAPTGAGKTRFASDMVLGASAKGSLCYFVVHRQELVDQTALTFDELGIKYSYIAANYDYDPQASSQICSMDTLVRRHEHLPHPDFVIVDEAHHAIASSWKRVLDYWPDATVVGLSATPQRLDGRGLGEFFTSLVTGPPVFDLISQGYLSEYELIAPPVGIDTSKLHTVAGDFNKGELAAMMDNADLIGSIVDHWLEHANGKKTLGFAVNVKHSQHIAQAFVDRGIAAHHLDAKTSKGKRRAVLRAYAEGEFDVLWNVGLFGEGFDLEMNAGIPCTVESVISARPTQSLSIWLQCVGRALRPKADGSKAIILDHAGNVWRHGLPCAERTWSLDAKKSKHAVAPVKRCKECFAVVASFVMECPLCGAPFPKAEGKGIEVHDGKLEKLDVAGMRSRTLARFAAERQEQDDCVTFEALVALGEKREYRLPRLWAMRLWENRCGT